MLEPILREESSIMIYADAGVGKTWLAWEMIIAVAGGGEFAGCGYPRSLGRCSCWMVR